MKFITPVTRAVTNKVGRQVLIVQSNSPKLLFVAGVAGVVATVVLASRATLQMEEILKEAQHNEEQINDVVEERPEKYSEEDRVEAVAGNKFKTAAKIVKIYTPAFAVGVLSIAALTGSHVILTRRNSGLAAAYALVDQGFKQYRQRVVDELGPQKDLEFRYGYEDKEIGVDTDEGVSIKTVRVLNPNGEGSIYSRMFGESCMNWQRSPMSNQVFLSAQQAYMNDLLKSRGHVWLNEVYEALGMDHTKEGAVVGWLKDNHPDAGDGYISFGVFDNVFDGKEFTSGRSKEILLDFNVDGVIYDKIRKGRG